MKGFAKAFVVSGITLGAILGLNVTEHNGVSNEAKAQTAHTVTGINIMVILHRVATLYLAIHFIKV